MFTTIQDAHTQNRVSVRLSTSELSKLARFANYNDYDCAAHVPDIIDVLKTMLEVERCDTTTRSTDLPALFGGQSQLFFLTIGIVIHLFSLHVFCYPNIQKLFFLLK